MRPHFIEVLLETSFTSDPWQADFLLSILIFSRSVLKRGFVWVPQVEARLSILIFSKSVLKPQ